MFVPHHEDQQNTDDNQHRSYSQGVYRVNHTFVTLNDDGSSRFSGLHRLPDDEQQP